MNRNRLSADAPDFIDELLGNDGSEMEESESEGW